MGERLPKPKLRCAIFDHALIVVGRGEEERADVQCRRCGTPGPPQRCPWCDQPMTMIPRIDREVHADCIGKQGLMEVLGG